MTDKLMPTEHDNAGFPAGFGTDAADLAGPGPAGLAPPASSSRLSGQVVLAAAVLALAGGAIYGMRFYGLNAAFGGEDIKIDYSA